MQSKFAGEIRDTIRACHVSGCLSSVSPTQKSSAPPRDTAWITWPPQQYGGVWAINRKRTKAQSRHRTPDPRRYTHTHAHPECRTTMAQTAVRCVQQMWRSNCPHHAL